MTACSNGVAWVGCVNFTTRLDRVFWGEKHYIKRTERRNNLGVVFILFRGKTYFYWYNGYFAD